MGGEEECPCSDFSDHSMSTTLSSDNAYTDTKTSPVPKKHDDFVCIPGNRFTSVSCQAEPANFVRNEPSFCLCQAYRLTGCNIPANCQAGNPQEIPPIWSRINWKWPRSGYLKRRDKTYDIKVKKKRCQHFPKAYSCSELSEGIPRKKEESTNQNQDAQESAQEEPVERIDIYYFDHGNSAYYRTTDSPPIVAAERRADKTENAAIRFWAEIFGTLHIALALVIALILQLLRFILYSVVRPLTVGILQMLADYFIKPLLSIVFNAMIQPFLILLYNVATSFRDLCEPIAEAIGFFLKEIANVLRAFRIVEINHIAGEKEKNFITACT